MLILHVCGNYYKQVNSKELTEDDFKLWIESLDEPMKGVFINKGLELSRGVLFFQRFILEVRNKGLNEYLKNNLTDEDFSYWIANKKNNEKNTCINNWNFV